MSILIVRRKTSASRRERASPLRADSAIASVAHRIYLYIERSNPKIRVEEGDIESVVVEEKRIAVTETGQRVIFRLKAAAAKK